MRQRKIFLLSGLLFSLIASGFPQSANFSVPDTICEDKPVFITNVQPPNAISYRWSFCSGNASDNPDGINTGNPNQILNAPRWIALVKDSLEYYTFTTSSGNSKLLRCFYGSSLALFPVAITDFGNLGIFTGQIGGIQVKKDNGIWYGLVVDGNRLIRLNFGSSPANSPTPQTLILPGVSLANGLAIVKQGTEWIGFCTDLTGNILVRLYFGTSLGNDPQVTNLGDVGQFWSPAGIVVAKENNVWYALICNNGNRTISRIAFGSTLMNPAPAGTVLTQVQGLDLASGITLVYDCGGLNGFVTNCVLDADRCVVRLVFPNGLGGPVSGYLVPNNGYLNKPCGITEFVRQGDTLFAYAANYGSSSLTRIFFPSCSGASQPFYTGSDPPPITYENPGEYNILLTVNDANAIESSKCRKIVVMPKPFLSLGPDRAICNGDYTILNADFGDSLFLWSTGATTGAITVYDSGTYWVHTTNYWNCEASDTIRIRLKASYSGQVDTTVCEGLTYWVQKAYRDKGGTYHDTLVMKNGCDSIIVTNLSFKECPLTIWFPNAFTPNGDGLNDRFLPNGKDITNYTLRIFNRWGGMVFEAHEFTTGWDGYVKGRKAQPDVYTYDAVFEHALVPGVVHRQTGTVILTE